MGGIDFHAHLAPAASLPNAHSLPAALREPKQLEAWLTDRGLDGAAVSIPPPYFRRDLDERDAKLWTRAVNDGLADLTQKSPRLVPLSYVPLEHPDLAVLEFERVVDAGEFGGVVACAGGPTALDDRRLDPFWAGLQSTRLPLFLHPGATADSRLKRYYLGNLLGNPYETGVAAAQLIFGNVLADHPNLRIILAHGGGVIAAVLGRWQRGLQCERPGLPNDSGLLRDALACLWVDCIVHDDAVLDLVVHQFGLEHVVLGSDWPFPMGLDDPANALAHLGGPAVTQVATLNAHELVRGIPNWHDVMAVATSRTS